MRAITMNQHHLLFVGFASLILACSKTSAEGTRTIIEGSKGRLGGTRIGDATADLQVILRTDKYEYKTDEPIFIDFRIYNTGKKTINVYNELKREGWLVMFEIRDKKTRKPVYQSSPVRIPSRRMRDSLYLVLPSGGTTGRFYAIHNSGKPFPEGEYEIQAGYTNSYETCLASLYFTEKDIKALGRHAYVRLWTGRILSNPIPINLKGQLAKDKDKSKKKKNSWFKKKRRPK